MSIVKAFIIILGFLVFVPQSFAQIADDYGTASTTNTVGNYCPKLSTTMVRGARDVSTSGQVSELQKFISSYYDIDPEEMVTGFFGRITQSYVIRYQKEQGLPALGIAGSLTRASIAKTCAVGAGPVVPVTKNPLFGQSQIPGLPLGCTLFSSFSYITGEKCVATPTITISKSSSSVVTNQNSTQTTIVSTSTLQNSNQTVVVSTSTLSTAEQAFPGTKLVTPSIDSPVIVRFTASKMLVAPSSPVVLKWDAYQAGNCAISTDGKTVLRYLGVQGGMYTMYPKTTAKYTLTCRGSKNTGEVVEKELTVVIGNDTATTSNQTSTTSVQAFPGTTLATSSVNSPLIIYFDSNYSQVVFGKPVELSWDAHQAGNCAISANDKLVLPFLGAQGGGSYTMNPKVTTKYTLTCRGNKNTDEVVEKELTVVIGGSNIPLTSYFKSLVPVNNQYEFRSFVASASSTLSRKPVVLTWLASNTSCLLEQGNVKIIYTNPIGWYVVYPVETTKYSLTCGGIKKDLTITVNGLPYVTSESVYATSTTAGINPLTDLPLINSFSVESATIKSGSPVILTWNALNAASCQLFANGTSLGYNNVDGWKVLFPAGTTSYKLSCLGAKRIGDMTSRTIVVTVE